MNISYIYIRICIYVYIAVKLCLIVTLSIDIMLFNWQLFALYESIIYDPAFFDTLESDSFERVTQRCWRIAILLDISLSFTLSVFIPRIAHFARTWKWQSAGGR